MAKSRRVVVGIAVGMMIVAGACATQPRAPRSAQQRGPVSSAENPAARGAEGGQGGTSVMDASVAQAAAEMSAPQSRRTPLPQIEASQLREKAIAILEGAAFDSWAMLRANAIEGLSVAPARAEPVIRAGLADENPGVRFVAAMTAGKLEMASMRSALGGLLSDPDDSVRAAAIFALTKVGDRPDRTPLARMLMYGTLTDRANAAFVLGELKDASAEPMLRDAAKRLATLGGDPAIGPSASRLLRLHVALALVKLGQEEMVQTLRAALYPSAIEEVEGAVVAAQMLGEVRDEGAIAQLVRMVEYRVDGTEDWVRFEGKAFLYPLELRLAAATSLAKMDQPDGVYVGVMHERNPSATIRAQITFLYGAVGGAPAARRLGTMMDDPDPQVRLAAAANLVRVVDGGRGVRRGG